MIDLITGVPGSGKTYYEADKIYKLITSKEKKYKHIFTNINGLDYKKCNELANELDYVQPFEFMDLKKHMDIEYSYHLQSKNITANPAQIQIKFNEVSIEEYNSYNEVLKLKYDKEKEDYTNNKKTRDDKEKEELQLKEHYDDYVKEKGCYDKYSDALVIIDECHLYFESREDDVLIRFLSYHRHFNIDLDLVTQNKNLLNKKYLSFIETMYVAYPASKRLFSKKFRYKKYASYQEYHANIMGNISLALTKKIFDLYSSGSNVVGKSTSSKFLFPVLLVSFVTFLAFYFIIDSFSKDKKVTNNDLNTTHTRANPVPVKTSKNDFISTDNNYFLVTCFSKNCNFKDIDYSFDDKVMFRFIEKFQCKITISDTHNPDFSTYLLNCNSELKDVLYLYKTTKPIKRQKDEKGTTPSFLN